MAAIREWVCVYGTLRRGAAEHARMAGAEFVRACFIRGRMYRIDWYPGVVLDDGAGMVRVEVFAVDSRLLAELDGFEGDEYRRVRCNAVPDDSGESFPEFWIWEWKGACEEERYVETGDWLDS